MLPKIISMGLGGRRKKGYSPENDKNLSLPKGPYGNALPGHTYEDSGDANPHIRSINPQVKKPSFFDRFRK